VNASCRACGAQRDVGAATRKRAEHEKENPKYIRASPTLTAHEEGETIGNTLSALLRAGHSQEQDRGVRYGDRSGDGPGGGAQEGVWRMAESLAGSPVLAAFPEGHPCGDGIDRRLLEAGMERAGRALHDSAGELEALPGRTGEEDGYDRCRVAGRSAAVRAAEKQFHTAERDSRTARSDPLAGASSRRRQSGAEPAGAGTGRRQHQVRRGGQRHPGGMCQTYDSRRDRWQTRCGLDGRLGNWPAQRSKPEWNESRPRSGGGSSRTRN
jgi:hypothetical protein